MYVNWLPVPCRKGCRQQPSVVPLLVPLLYSALRASFSQQCYASAHFLLLIHIVLKCPASLPLCIVTYILFRFHSALAVLTAFAPALLLCITFSSAVPISVFLSFFFTNSLFLSVTLAHSQNFSLPASIALPSHTLCRNTNDFSGMRMRLKSGPRLFYPCRQRVSMSNLIHVNSQEEWRIRRTVREEKSGTERERGREGVREREIPSVHCYSRLHSNIVSVASS